MADRRTSREENADLGREEVQEQVNAEQEQGFVGNKVDPTPNEAYTVSGVTHQEPTPETDAGAAREAAAASGIGPEASASARDEQGGKQGE